MKTKIKMFLRQVACASMLLVVGLSFVAISPARAQVTFDANICIGNACPDGDAGSGWLENKFGLPESTIYEIISGIMNWLLLIFGILGVIGFVLSGIFYLLAGANEDNAEKGKKGMTMSIVGIIVGLSGFIILQAVDNMLRASDKF